MDDYTDEEFDKMQDLRLEAEESADLEREEEEDDQDYGYRSEIDRGHNYPSECFGRRGW